MKTWRIVYDPQALDDLDEIHDWVARHSSARTADRYEQRIIAYIERLRNFPNRGKHRDDIAAGLRLVAFEERIDIAYRIQEDRVEIVRFLYAGRQFGSAEP